MKKTYRHIIFGATCAALGFAATHEDTLILEPTEMVGTDFAGCLRYAGRIETMPTLPAACDFYQFIQSHGVARDGYMDIPALVPVLHRYIRSQGMPVLFLTRPASVREEGDVTVIEAITNEGILTFQAAQWLEPHAETSLEKCLNLLCHQPGSGFGQRLQGYFGPDCAIQQTRRAGEYLVSIAFPAETQLHEARATVIEGWRQIFDEGEALISMLAFAFEHPSAYSNPIQAFEEGAKGGALL